MSNIVKKTEATAISQLQSSDTIAPPGDNHVNAADATKSFVSFEAVESLVLDERPEMIALVVACTLTGGGLAMLVLVALLGAVLPPWAVALPWWVWLTPAFASAVAWIRVRRSSRRRFTDERAAWMKHLDEKAREAFSQAVVSYKDGIAKQVLDQWPPLEVSTSVFVRMREIIIGLDNATSTVGCDIDIVSLSPRRCRITIQGGSVTLYRLSEPGITKLKPPIEQVKSVSFDGCTEPGNLPISTVNVHALLTESRVNEIRALFQGDSMARAAVAITYTVEVDGRDTGEIAVDCADIVALLPSMILPKKKDHD